jgi:hypothetical protein
MQRTQPDNGVSVLDAEELDCLGLWRASDFDDPLRRLFREQLRAEWVAQLAKPKPATSDVPRSQ